MTAILGAQEFCRKGHLRTPANTYTPPGGRRQCRVCAGTMPADGGQRGRPSERFDELQLARLRELVRCVHCGAVPTETGETREVSDGHGGALTLPIVVTPHVEGCAGSTRTGRPKRAPKGPRYPAGPCEHCGTPMKAGASHVAKKRFCSSTCRKAAKRVTS